MKWFFAFNQKSEPYYSDFVRVAVLSARRHTELEAFCLYDGVPSELTHWLEEQNVRVVPCRFRLAKWWEEVAAKNRDPLAERIALGAFLRLEIPDLTEREGLEDEFVLYTDCDVMFERDVAPLLAPLRPRYFSVAPETFRFHRLHMNSGVMWMNLPQLRARNAAFMRFAEQHMLQASAASFDQGIYRAFFNPPHRLAWKLGVSDRWFYAVMSRLRLKTWQWDDLPLELNWKPYWGDNPNAAIVHFHGLKPTQRGELAAGTLSPVLSRMRTPSWDECVRKWDAWLDEARAL